MLRGMAPDVFRLFYLLACAELVLSGCVEKPLISQVKDSQLTASTSWNDSVWDHRPPHSRLSTQEDPKRNAGAWCALTNDKNQWIQVDFAKRVQVTAVVTKGRHSNIYPQWVSSYILGYSCDGSHWKTYKEKDGSVKVFRGNFNQNTAVKHYLKPFQTKLLRLYPQTWHNHVSLRWEVLGCKLPGGYCPPGFSYLFPHGTPTNMVTKPYHWSCYKFSTDQETWLSARKKCLAARGDLVSVETAGEQHHLESIIHSNPALQRPRLTDSRTFGYWTSGTDTLQEGKWIWAATGRALMYKAWGPSQPDNNYAGSHYPENCLHLWRLVSYKWNDLPCHYSFVSYICETRALPYNKQN